MNEIQTFGDFQTLTFLEGEYLTLGFSPGSAPLKHRWESNGLSADFIAEYFRYFHIDQKSTPLSEADLVSMENLQNTVKYIANELLENAMKFQDVKIPFTASIYLALDRGSLVFAVTNAITEKVATSLRGFIENLLQNNPNDLYFEAMRNSAKEENKGSSGLGLLSMICDHSAKIGWQFKPTEIEGNEQKLIIVTTTVGLEL